MDLLQGNIERNRQSVIQLTAKQKEEVMQQVRKDNEDMRKHIGMIKEEFN